MYRMYGITGKILKTLNNCNAKGSRPPGLDPFFAPAGRRDPHSGRGGRGAGVALRFWVLHAGLGLNVAPGCVLFCDFWVLHATLELKSNPDSACSPATAAQPHPPPPPLCHRTRRTASPAPCPPRCTRRTRRTASPHPPHRLAAAPHPPHRTRRLAASPAVSCWFLHEMGNLRFVQTILRRLRDVFCTKMKK